MWWRGSTPSNWDKVAGGAWSSERTEAPAQAPYPAKPIRVLVPYAPGGLTDVVARLYSEQLGQSRGRGVVVRADRGPGAGTVSGKTDQGARALCAGRADRCGGAALLRAIATKSRAGRVRREQARRLRNRR